MSSGALVTKMERVLPLDAVEDPTEVVVTELSRIAGTARNPFREWSSWVPEPKSGPLDFDRFPYQHGLYGDDVAEAREVVVMKSTQVGITALMWRWGGWRCDQFGDTVLYTFPTTTHVNEFGDERIEPSIRESKYLSSRISQKSVRHKSLKQIGLGWLHLKGSESKAGALSVAAEVVVFDEYDRLNQRNVTQMELRLSGAQAAGRVPRLRRVGTPTLPGFGIALAFDGSDRRLWHVTCGECGHVQVPEWESNVRWTVRGSDDVLRPGRDVVEAEVERAWRACSQCEAELDVADGEWVATNPSSSTIGFHVTRLIVPYTDLVQIVKNSRKTKPHEVESFWNDDLGLSYSPAEASLDEATILAACSHGGELQRGYSGKNAVTMGLDVAGERDLNARISEQLPDGRRRALWIGTLESFQAAAEKIEQFNVTLCVVDSNPERRMGRALAATFPGRVALCVYDHRNESDPFKYDEQRNIVTVNRTEAIDAMMDSLRQVRNMPLRIPPVGYVEQLKAPARRTEETTNGKLRRVYVSTGTHGDDYAHAEVYDLVATELWRMRVAVRQQLEGAEIEHIPDERIGFERLTLDLGTDVYDPGFGEGGLDGW